ncbi:phosphotransferase [Enteractinococcus coprophilus]|uniref:Aminoglycoside phosphotransferase (APT) family kinase protein n=1 Tax=Enteractinococcus coprophilus TaxID=1027633 RepID=A0A543A006_9MICC|nr:phosphotransferase [Enteractinococcus coprophilus]TQL65932.1 aminoglycoside phosphotransferase (APT) family kinase protein [Enteractinococcus coprophilus]
MKRTAMELAALASAAMPGLDIVQAAASPDDPRAFDSAIVTDTDNNHWRVRAPRNSQAAFRLETEIQVLSGFTPAIRAHLPFRVPSVAGAVQIDGLRTFIYHQMPGEPVDLGTITHAETQTIDDIGRIIAAIHKLPSAVVETADLPAYGAEQSRARLLSELDQMALTGKVPADLLRRWENAFEERQMWTFIPRVVHGDFDETSLLIDRNRAVGVTAWTDLHIGDPARDFMWLASTGSIEFRDAVISAYHRHMDLPADQVDLHLMRRAALAAEFSLGKYLMSGIHASDKDVIAEAQSMLRDLSADVDYTGGHDIGQQFWEPVAPPEPLVGNDERDAEAEAEPAVWSEYEPAENATQKDFDDDTETAQAQLTVEPDATQDTESASTEIPEESAETVSGPDQPDDAVEHTPQTAREDSGAELIVHSLSEDDQIIRHDVPQPAAEDEDTQPISWKVVQENLRRD